MSFTNENTLLTTYDVEYCTPAGQNFSSQLSRTYIVQEEETLFNANFGWDFYENLLADKISYDESNYSDSIEYAVNDVVLWRNQLHIALEVAKGEPPSNKTKWKIAPVFENENYDFLWHKYLKEVIGWAVITALVLPTSIQLTNHGAQKKSAEHTESVSLKGIHALKEDLQADIMRKVKNMDVFIRRNSSLFTGYGLTNGKSRKRRRPSAKQNDGWNLMNTYKRCC